jgi:hypothetical protein
MKNVIYHSKGSWGKDAVNDNNWNSILNKGFFIAIVLFSLLFCQQVFSKTIQKEGFNQTTDTIKKKKPNLSELESTKNAAATKSETDKVNVDLSELQKIAEYPGGLEKFYDKVITNFDNSEMDYDGFSKINVSFVIEKDGTMSAITVNDPTMSKSMKKSIVRVLKSIKTKWSPAIKNDQPVRTGYDLPIVFNAK